MLYLAKIVFPSQINKMNFQGERCVVSYHDGDIKEQAVDAIINFVYPEEHQRDAYGILAAAGEVVLAEFEKGKSQDNRLVRRGVVATSGGDLPFKKIYHIIATHQPAKMKDALHTALRQADRDQMKSMAIPKLSYDNDGDDPNVEKKYLDQNHNLFPEPLMHQEMVKILGLDNSEMTFNYIEAIHGYCFISGGPLCLNTIHVLVPASLSEIIKRLDDSSLRGFGRVFIHGHVYKVQAMCNNCFSSLAIA